MYQHNVCFTDIEIGKDFFVQTRAYHTHSRRTHVKRTKTSEHLVPARQATDRNMLLQRN